MCGLIFQIIELMLNYVNVLETGIAKTLSRNSVKKQLLFEDVLPTTLSTPNYTNLNFVTHVQ